MNTIIDFLNQDLFQGFAFVEKDGKIWVLMDKALDAIYLQNLKN